MKDKPQRDIHWSGSSVNETSALSREWLVTNGLGGFASGTLAGVVTRRYHGLLVAALPAPRGRTVMLNHLHERIYLSDNQFIDINDQELTDQRNSISGLRYLKTFQLVYGLPVWRYEIGDSVLEKRILMPHLQNTVHVTYRLLEGPAPLRVALRPAIHFRPQEASVDQIFVNVEDYMLSVRGDNYELQGGDFPPLQMKIVDNPATFTIDRRRRDNIYFRLEEARGYAFVGEHWSPGVFSIPLEVGKEFTFIASAETAGTLSCLTPQQAYVAELQRRQHLLATTQRLDDTITSELVLAADQFIITPAGRREETTQANAQGDEVKTVIAGYHWFTDWGRDTMISLEGLTLTTGRYHEARYILRTFANYVRDGLIPNMFPEHDKNGLYHTADASLWFFHALQRYVQATQDRETLRHILPKLINIVDHHLRGTRFNIGIDPNDGLLRQGQEGYQLTWMDAKVGDWVVTPRRGKAVELNALWYNALCLLANWLEEENATAAAQPLREHATLARASFNARFWYHEGGHLFDVVDGPDGDDSACRPNQVFSISLDHPILEPHHWKPVIDTVTQALLTPVGLRSLAPSHKEYKKNYAGDLRARDAAYHQGTVWAWLIGPYIDARLKVYPEDKTATAQVLSGFDQHLNDAGIGSISEIFDAEPPYTPRGCIAQAWSVAEVLRCRANLLSSA